MTSNYLNRRGKTQKKWTKDRNGETQPVSFVKLVGNSKILRTFDNWSDAKDALEQAVKINRTKKQYVDNDGFSNLHLE